jgi:hypothetical protein
MSISIKAEVTAGQDIMDASKEAISVADQLGIGVDFEFNGVTCLAFPGDSPRSLADAFRKELNSDHRYKIARGKPQSLADELRDQIPWSALQPEIRWVAMDANGMRMWHGFYYKPYSGNVVWFPNAQDTPTRIDEVVSMPEVDPARWRETLISRPEDT